MNLLLRKCSSILKACQKHVSSWPFQVPVDPVQLGIPDYFDKIKHPMDYSTIAAKLEGGDYPLPSAFKADCELVFQNCLDYNPPDSAVYQAAVTASDEFAGQWEGSGLDYEEQNEIVRRNGEDIEVEALPEEGPVHAEPAHAAPTGGGGAKVRDREAEKVRRMEREAKAKAERIAAGGGSAGRGRGDDDSDSDDDDLEVAPRQRPPKPSAPSARPGPPRQRPAPPAPPAPRPAMKFEQKRQLSVALANLPVQKQARVVQIISEQNLTKSEDDEIEIDLDLMDNATLWRLFDFVFPRSQQMQMGIPELYASEPVVQPPAPPVKAEAAGGDGTSSSDDSSDSDSDSASEGKAGAPKAGAASAPGGGSEGGDSASQGAKAAAAAANGAGAAVPASMTPPAAAAPDAVMLDASATAAAAPSILRDAPVKKDVTIANATSWANFAAGPVGGEGTGAAASEGGAVGGGGGAIPDALWSEFETKEADKKAREEQKRADEEAARADMERLQAEQRAAAAAALAQREAEEQAVREAAAKAEADKNAAREAAREAARAELMSVDQTVNLDEAHTLMSEMNGGFTFDGMPGFDAPQQQAAAAPPAPPQGAGVSDGVQDMEEGEV